MWRKRSGCRSTRPGLAGCISSISIATTWALRKNLRPDIRQLFIRIAKEQRLLISTHEGEIRMGIAPIKWSHPAVSGHFSAVGGAVRVHRAAARPLLRETAYDEARPPSSRNAPRPVSPGPCPRDARDHSLAEDETNHSRPKDPPGELPGAVEPEIRQNEGSQIRPAASTFPATRPAPGSCATLCLCETLLPAAANDGICSGAAGTGNAAARSVPDNSPSPAKATA